MRVKSFLPLSLAVLLAQGPTAAAAETPLPDPIAPAVIGRPLDQIGPVRRPAARPPVANQARPKPAAPPAASASRNAATANRNAATANRNAAAVNRNPAAVNRNAAAARPVPPRAVLGAAGQPPSPPQGVAQDAPASQRQARKAVDDRADPRMRLGEVGKGVHFARKPLGPGAYFGSKHRASVRKYYEQHPAAAGAANWRIGEPVPRGTAVQPVPQPLQASLPKLPPGHRYVQVGGEVLLIASGSGMVIDGISRSPR